MTKDKQARFDKLLTYYATSFYLAYKLLDSGLLERKIKVGSDTDKINALLRALIPAFATDLREAEQAVDEIKDIDNITYSASAIELATAYFDELNARGNEWEYADLKELFTDYMNKAKQELEDDKERW